MRTRMAAEVVDHNRIAAGAAHLVRRPAPRIPLRSPRFLVAVTPVRCAIYGTNTLLLGLSLERCAASKYSFEANLIAKCRGYVDDAKLIATKRGLIVSPRGLLAHWDSGVRRGIFRGGQTIHCGSVCLFRNMEARR